MQRHGSREAITSQHGSIHYGEERAYDASISTTDDDFDDGSDDQQLVQEQNPPQTQPQRARAASMRSQRLPTRPPSSHENMRSAVRQPQWRSRRPAGSRRSPSTSSQPITINLSFGAGTDTASSFSRNISIDSTSQRRRSARWVNEVTQATWPQSNNGNIDTQDSNMYQPQPPHLHAKASFTTGDDSTYYGAGEKAMMHAVPPPTSQLPPLPHERPHSAIASDLESGSEDPKPPRWVYPPVTSGFWQLIQNFDFKWYGSTMGTGIVSILIFTFSEVYPAAQALLFALSVMFYAINILLFTLIFSATILRYIKYPKLFWMMLSDPGQAMYVGTAPMGLATLITMGVNVIVPRAGGEGSGWALALWAFWWMDVVVSLACALGIPWLVQALHHGITDLSKMTAGWLLPIVAPIVAAATGAAVASVLPPNEALITIFTSYAILGTGLSAALAIIAIYYLRIATYKLPPVEHMVSTFLPLGPLGQGGFAFQQLGAQALRVFPETGILPLVVSSDQDRALAGKILFTFGFLAAIILWGFAMMWLFFAVMSVTRQKVPFSLGWWAFTFPLGVLATSTLTMGRNLPSVAFQTLGTLLGIAVMVLWGMVSGILVMKLIKGEKGRIFKAPEVTGDLNKMSV